MKLSARAGAAMASAVVVAIAATLMLLGPFNLAGSRLPDGLYGAFASHWQAGQPGDCRLCPESLFVVLCDADRRVHLRDLRQLAALRAEQQRGRDNGQAATPACLGGRGFRLGQSAGGYGAAYDEENPGFRFDLAFRVVRDGGAAQLVEVRFSDSRTDIDQALFLYEATDHAVRPLESWVVTRGHRQLAVAGVTVTLVLLVLAWGLYFSIAARRHRDPTA